jgi:RNA polymerase sigma factor (sigma-70 family)
MQFHSRKRFRAFGLVCAALSQVTVGYQPASTAGRRSSFISHPTSKSYDSIPVPTPQEQRKLLDQAVEMRRIKAIEKEMAMQTATLKVSDQAVCIEAGYEDRESLQAAVYQGQVARETLVTRNMGLVYFCINEIMGKSRSHLQSLSREDLLQEGAIGLARAVDRWDPAIGQNGRFSTYAMYWVRAAVLRCIAERDSIIRTPVHVTEAISKMTKAAKNLGLELNGESILSMYSSDDTWKEAKAAKALALEAGLTDRQLKEAMKVRRRRSSGMMSFESWMQKGKDFKADTPLVSEEETIATMDSEYLKNTLSRFLRPREIEALSWRYGINSSKRDYVAEAEEELFGSSSKKATKKETLVTKGKWGEAMSFVEVGKRMEISAEYGRRLTHAALEKLRRAADEGTLEPALLW